MRVEAGRVGRLPQHQQRGLVPEPHDELARSIRLYKQAQTLHVHHIANIRVRMFHDMMTCQPTVSPL